ncbi:hypothetical protein RhiirA4_548786 [Rhizophagus irregularis]|uniref:Uncharacterized protein n=1 Tax=Rhizophagus irregularis TaxID=588596 RepID=A0A2I1H9J7_9GLOM|nr:hypothetical protein RhiirA4_548786 [Rhizophagus irregularis]
MTQNFYLWEDAINKINFRTSSKDDVNITPFITFITFTTHTYTLIIFFKTWEQIWERKLLPNLPSIINKIAFEYSSMLNSFIPMKDIHDWSNNFLKLEDYLFLHEKDIDTNNEDTFVYEMLHDLLNEIFHDPMFELIWVNSESFVFKNCYTSTSGNKENSRGEKPDFKIITNLKEEILFGEIGLASFRVWVSGSRIWIYEMDLNYDGIYRMFLKANVVIPTERAQFLNLIPVLEALYGVNCQMRLHLTPYDFKDRMSEVLKIFATDTLPSSPRSTYIRMPIPPQKLVKIPIVQSSCATSN